MLKLISEEGLVFWSKPKAAQEIIDSINSCIHAINELQETVTDIKNTVSMHDQEIENLENVVFETPERS